MPDESRETGPGPVEHFAPTGGRVSGILGLLVAAGIVLLWVVDRDQIITPVAAAALVGAVIAYAALLRPRVSATPETLILRNMLETVHVPLAAVDELVVRQVLAVRVGERRFVSPAVGRKLRKVIKGPRPSQLLGPTMPDAEGDALGPQGAPERAPTEVDYVDHVESRLRQLVDDARERHGVRRYSDEAAALADGVRREPAWPEIGALAGTTLVFVVSLLL